MATLKQRLHRKNASGSYDVVHLETSADMVLRSDGTTVDAALNDRYAMSVSRTANTVLAAPNGSDGSATFRKLVAADIPSLATSKITSGSFSVARGGTGRSTLTSGYFLRGNGTSAVTMTAPADVLAAIGAMANVAVTTSDNGKFLRVVSGAWAAAAVPNAEEASF